MVECCLYNWWVLAFDLHPCKLYITIFRIHSSRHPRIILGYFLRRIYIYHCTKNIRWSFPFVIAKVYLATAVYKFDDYLFHKNQMKNNKNKALITLSYIFIFCGFIMLSAFACFFNHTKFSEITFYGIGANIMLFAFYVSLSFLFLRNIPKKKISKMALWCICVLLFLNMTILFFTD